MTPVKGKNPNSGCVIFKGQDHLRAEEWFDDLCQIAQLVAHLTTKNSEGGGSNLGLVHHFFSHPVIGHTQCRGLCNS